MNKKIIALSLAGTMMASLCACGKVEEPSREINGIRNTPAVVQAVNDTVRNISAGKLFEMTGITLTAPEGAEDITYNVLCADSPVPIAEVEYTLKKNKIFIRASKRDSELFRTLSDEFNISGMYYNFKEPVETYIHLFSVYTFVSGEASYSAWYDEDEGVLYNFCVKSLTDETQMQKLQDQVFVLSEEEQEVRKQWKAEELERQKLEKEAAAAEAAALEAEENGEITEEYYTEPVVEVTDEITDMLRTLLADISELAPGMANYGQKLCAVTGRFMDFCESNGNNITSDELSELVHSWLSAYDSGDRKLYSGLANGISLVKTKAEAYLINMRMMNDEVAWAGYTKQYDQYNRDTIEAVLQCIADSTSY